MLTRSSHKSNQNFPMPPKQNKRNPSQRSDDFRNMSADNFFDHLEEGGLSAILTSLTSSTPLSSAVANKGEVVKALFVCILCNPISDGERPKLRIYDSNSSCVQEIGLEMSERDHRVFTCFVSARPFENLCCKVAVTLRDGNYCKENVKHDQQIYSRPAFRNYQFHSKDGLIFAAVVRDLFVSKYTRFNHIGTIEEAFRGWVGLLGWIITYFGEQYHNWAECIHAIPDDLKFHAGDQLHSNRYTCLPLVDLLEVLTLDGPRSGPYIGSAGFLSVTELKSRKKCRNLATLLKWIWLADYTAVKTHVKLVADSAAFEAIEHLDVTEVYEAILAASEFSPDFLLAAKTFMSLLVDATSYYTTVRWAMLRVALSPDYQAKNVIRSYHRGAVPYLALFLHPSVSPNTTIAVFSVFPNLRVFRSLQSGEYVLPADVVTNICGPYYQPPNDPEGGIEEYQALQHFVLKNEKLIFKFFKSFKHLSVDSAALDSLTTQDRAEIALMPLIQRLADFPVSEPTARQQVEELVTQRCRILRIYLQPSTLYADALFVKMLYNILRELLKYQRVPGVLEAVRDLSTALPAANCVGLIYRFAAYLKEECAELAALECEVFQIICRKPENDPVSMRKPFWEVLPKVLKVGDTVAWGRAAKVLADLWTECYKRATDKQLDSLFVTERQELTKLGFAPSDDDDPVLAFLLLEPVRTLFELITTEIATRPVLLQTDHYLTLQDQYARPTELRVVELARILHTQELYASTLEVLLKHPELYANIHYFVPSFDRTDVDKAAAKMYGIRKALSSLLAVFRDHMPLHPRFQACSIACVAQLEELSASLERKHLCEWVLPDFAGGGEELRALATRLRQAQGSLLYMWIWNRQCEAEVGLEVATDTKTAIKQWMESVLVSMTSWETFIEQIKEGRSSRSDLQEVLLPVLESIPEAPEIPTNPIEAVQAAERHAHTVLIHFESAVAAEIAVTEKVLLTSSSAVGYILVEFSQAVLFQPQVQALVDLAAAVHCPYDAAHEPLCRFLAAMNSAEGTVAGVRSTFGEVKSVYPQVSGILTGFPQLLVKLLGEGLHTLLNSYPEVSTLDQVVRRKVGEAAGQRDQMLLMALFETRKALETILEPTGYPSLVNLNFRSMSILVKYLASVSWGTSCLRPLVGGIGLLSDLLQGGASVASTVVLVHALIGTGEFSITVRDQEVHLSASALVDKDGVPTSRTFTATELGDIPFKLYMVGVQKSTDEVQIQQHFLQVMEQLKVLSQAVLALSVAGHPNFQDCTLVVRGSIKIEEIKALVKEQAEKHSKWQLFLSTYADVHLPLLACFSRHQLVESLRFVGRPEYTVKTANLLRTVCPTMSSTAAVQLVTDTVPLVAEGEDGGTLSSKEIFAQVHQLLLAAAEHIVPPVPQALPADMRVPVNLFLASTPDKLKAPAGKISVLKLPANNAYMHSAVACALSIALKKRLPAAIELFCCSPETTEQAATDFIRRWAAAKYFAPLLPSSAGDLQFCMLNVEQLPSHIQGVLASQLYALRRSVEVPLLFVVSVDRDADSLLSLGLREDWVQCADLDAFVSQCLPLCSTFLRQEMPRIQVYRAASPSSGKTTAVLKDHAVSSVDANNRVKYAALSITGNADDAVEVLRAVERDRLLVQSEVDESAVVALHLNVSSHFDTEMLNRFLLQYLITGVLTDSKGSYVVRNSADTVAIEWPSEGILADKAWAQCPLLSCFACPPIARTLDLVSYKFDACLPHAADCVLYHVTVEEDAKLKSGVQMALAFFAVSSTSAFDRMPFCADVPQTVIPEPLELFRVFSQQMLHPSEDIPEPPAGQVYRFVRFLAHQMHGLSKFSYYNYASAEQDLKDDEERIFTHRHCRNYRRLAYHFANSSLKLARLLAASAVDPLTADTDDDSRLSSLRFSFDSWRDMPFLIFSENGDYQAISVSDSDILASMTAEDNFQPFRLFVREHRSSARVQSMVDLVTSGLTKDNYDPASCMSDHHALKILLPMISEVSNFGSLIFRALQDPALCASPHTTIASMMRPAEEGDDPSKLIHDAAVLELRKQMGDDNLSEDDTFAEFKEVARQWFLRMTGSYTGQKAPFVLTKDNLIRLLTVKMRLICRVPVVFVGETGCGKTHLVHFFSQISGQRMETYNIYGGIKPADVLKEMQAILQRAQGQEVVVLLDEINSNSNVWMIKELVCDRCVLGRRIPDNVRFICIMNPRRLRNSSAAVEAHGLDYSQRHSNAQQQQLNLSTVPETASAPLLVYEVFRSPESLMNLVWDFGMPSESFKHPDEARRICHDRTDFPPEISMYMSDELMFTENLVHWMVTARLNAFNVGQYFIGEVAIDVGLSADFAGCNGDADGTARHYPYFRALLSALIDTSQRFMRTEQGLCDKSAASLRDISRVISQIPFLMDLQVRHARSYTPKASERNTMYFNFLAVAVQASLILNYALRIVDERQRAVYLERIRTAWMQVRADRAVSDAFLPVPEEPAQIYGAFDKLALKLCSSLLCPKGIAMNQALKENVLSLFCAVMGDEGTGIFQFIVGRPGSTKSSSLDILCASSDPSSQDPRSKFFRDGWFSISKFLLQCTPDTTAQDILKLAQTAASAQRLKPTWRCIIVLEEVGVTLGSKHNPLMVLHGLIDRGVPMEDGNFVKLPIIGISNWQLDGSKMSRMRTTYRGNPSVDDLVKTAECIMEIAATEATAVSSDVLRRFATVFRNLVLSDAERDISWFYGMRDFYAFVQFLQLHHSFSLTRELKLQDLKSGAAHRHKAQLDPHLVQWAVQVSFGGHPNKALEARVCNSILRCFSTQSQVQAVRWSRRAAIASDSAGRALSEQEQALSAEHLCDMCARVAHYVDKKLSAEPVKEAAAQVQLFNAHFVEHQSINSRCTQLESASAFPVISVLSYCLNVYQAHMAIKYRVRHVLLFSRANAGLRLLFSLGIVNKKETHIIFGRVNASETEKLDDLLLVRRCMQSGMVLILVGAHHISESLYDALNQHYVAEGEGENRVELTRLTMNGYTASFPVHPSFRCISIEQEETCRSLLPPYINRFTKAHLNYSSALSVSQVNVARSIRAKSTVTADDATSIDLLRLLIPGLSADTVDSLAFLVHLQTAPALTLPEAVNLCCDLLSFIVVPRRLQQLLCGLYETLNGDLINEKVNFWSALMNYHRSHSLAEDFGALQAIRAKLTPAPVPHLCLFTEQAHLSAEDVQTAIQVLFPDCKPLANSLGFINLNKATDKQMAQLLAQLEGAEDGCFCCAYFDTTRIAGSQVTQLVDRFMHLVSSADLTARKHVVLIGLLMNSSTPGRIRDDLQLHFDPLWNYLFVDEICESEDQRVCLDNMLDGEDGGSLVGVLTPSVLAWCIASRALSIAQHAETRDGVACSALASRLEDMFSDSDDEVVLAVCEIICHNLAHGEEAKDGAWKKAALRKIKHAHSLREHFTLFLQAFVERALLQFSTELFSFQNFLIHCAADSPTRGTFVHLMRSPLIISERSLSACVDVDLPIPRYSGGCGGVGDGGFDGLSVDVMEMFTDSAVAVSFPFSFLVANLLHPAAKASGRESCQAKREMLLSGLNMAPELVDRYHRDVMTHALQIADPAAQRAFMHLVNELQGGSSTVTAPVVEEWEVIDGKSGIEEKSMDPPDEEERHQQQTPPGNVNSNLECLHMLLLENRSWVEAAVRVVTSPSLKIPALLADQTAPLLRSLVQSTALPSGIIPLEAVADIACIAGEHSFLLQLHQAVSTATAQQSEEVQRAAADLVQRVTAADAASHDPQHPSLLLEEAFLAGDVVALQWSKFLLPVIYRANEQDPGRVLVVLLNGVERHFDLLPRASVSSILKKAIDWWIKTNQQQQQPELSSVAELLLAGLQSSIASHGGNDGSFAVLVSRCMFDICETPAAVMVVHAKVESISADVFPSAKAVLISGWVTSALYLLCKALTSELTNASDDEEQTGETPDEEKGKAQLQTAQHLQRVTEAVQSCLETHDAILYGSALFALRTLSSGGVEIDTAKSALLLNKHLPAVVAGHQLCAMIMREAEGVPSSMHLLQGYTLAIDVWQKVLAVDTPVSADLLLRFDELEVAGKMAALLEVGFCRGASEQAISAEHLLTLNSTMLPRLPGQALSSFCASLLRPQQDLPQALQDMQQEHRRLFVLATVLILTSEAPVLQYYRSIALRTEPAQDVLPIAANAQDEVAQMQRFLFIAANLVYQVMHNVAAPPEDAVRVHTDHVIQNILPNLCPGCRNPVAYVNGCFSLTCPRCNHTFCGWCFGSFPDPHRHVMGCAHNVLRPGSYEGSPELWAAACRARVHREATQYFDNSVPVCLKAAVLDATLTEFVDLSVPVADLIASVGYTAQYCTHEIAHAVVGVKEGCFATAMTEDPAIAWMEAFLLLQLASVRVECADMTSANNCVRDAVLSCPQTNLLVEQLRAQAQAAIGDASEIPALLSWNAAYEATVSGLSLDELSAQLPHHFARRTRATAQMFWREINSDDRFVMLSYLGQREKSLDPTSAEDMMLVLNYVGEVVRICAAKQMSRQQATTTILAKLAADYPVLGGEQLVNFCGALQRMYHRVERWECRDKQELDKQFGNLVWDGSLPLVYLLPQTRDEGLLINVLYHGTADPVRDDSWKSLGAAQNSVVRELATHCQAPVRNAAHRPFSLTEDDLAIFDMQKLVYEHLLSLYIDPQPVVQFTDDLENLQWQVVHSASLWGKPLLATTLPEFAYAEEQKSSVFGKLAAVVDRYGGVLPLRPVILNRLLHMAMTTTARNCSNGDCLIAFLTILAAELISRPPYQEPYFLSGLADLIPVALTEEQKIGRELLFGAEGGVFKDTLRPQHILTLVEPLWDGALCPKCCVPLDDATAAAVEAALLGIVQNPETMVYAPQLRAAFRMLGLQKLCVEQVAGYYTMGFVDMLETMVVGPDLPIDELLRNNIIGQIHTQHYDAVYKMADRILSTVPSASAEVDSEAPSAHALLFDVKIEEIRSLFSAPAAEQAMSTSASKVIAGTGHAPAQQPQLQPPLPPLGPSLAPPVAPPLPPQQQPGQGRAVVHRWEGRGLLIDLDI